MPRTALVLAFALIAMAGVLVICQATPIRALPLGMHSKRPLVPVHYRYFPRYQRSYRL
jgi:hypothetical protein